jgi:hypothetical protein
MVRQSMDFSEHLSFDFTTGLNASATLWQHGDAEGFAEAAGIPVTYGSGADGTNVFSLPDMLATFPHSLGPGSEMIGTHEGDHPHHGRPAILIEGVVRVFGASDEYDEDGELSVDGAGGDDDSETAYCGTDPCEMEAVETHPVSLSLTEVAERPLCYICSQSYSSGAQHGEFRAIRKLLRLGHREAAEALMGGPISQQDAERVSRMDPLAEW